MFSRHCGNVLLSSFVLTQCCASLLRCLLGPSTCFTSYLKSTNTYIYLYVYIPTYIYKQLISKYTSLSFSFSTTYYNIALSLIQYGLISMENASFTSVVYHMWISLLNPHLFLMYHN